MRHIMVAVNVKQTVNQMVSGLNLSSKLHMLNITQIVAYKTSNPDKANVNKNVAMYNDQYEFKCTHL